MRKGWKIMLATILHYWGRLKSSGSAASVQLIMTRDERGREVLKLHREPSYTMHKSIGFALISSILFQFLSAKSSSCAKLLQFLKRSIPLIGDGNNWILYPILSQLQVRLMAFFALLYIALRSTIEGIIKLPMGVLRSFKVNFSLVHIRFIQF